MTIYDLSDHYEHFCSFFFMVTILLYSIERLIMIIIYWTLVSLNSSTYIFHLVWSLLQRIFTIFLFEHSFFLKVYLSYELPCVVIFLSSFLIQSNQTERIRKKCNRVQFYQLARFSILQNLGFVRYRLEREINLIINFSLVCNWVINVQ